VVGDGLEPPICGPVTAALSRHPLASLATQTPAPTKVTALSNTAMGHYYELDLCSVQEFASPFLDGRALNAEEIGDGNLNRVFRVSGASSSVIVKQALPYLKVVGTSWPLTRHRARIEADAGAEHGKLAPGAIPDVLDFKENLSAIVFEDLRGYSTWRELLILGRHVPEVAERVARYSAAVLLGTSHLGLESRAGKDMRNRFSYSELCLVTEELVFTAPYTGSQSNRFDEEIAEEARALAADRSLRTAVAELRFAFKTRDEALVHGDLHTGSVLVGADDAKVIDLEFAFFGPFGFDPGLLLANLALARIAHEASGDDRFATLVDGFAHLFWQTFADECRRRWRPTEPWYSRFLASLLADAARFAGLEMIRRIVGLAHVADIDSLPQPARSTAQRDALGGGRALVTGSPCTTFEELWLRATQEERFA
jgi:5-methylthioribose kinase